MKNRYLINTLVLLLLTSPLCAADTKRVIAIDESNSTNDSIKINGTKINYSATTGTQPVWDK